MVVTVAERKARRVAELRAAAGRAMAELADYARQQQGRFVVFGSMARGTPRYDSDFDLLVDFPAAGERPARDFAEDLCIRLGLKPDIHLRSEAAPALLARIARDGVALP